MRRADRPGRCEICGEPMRSDVAEMYDRAAWEATHDGPPSVICHAECGLANGLEVA